MYPTIGRIVHYVMDLEGERKIFPAIITAVYGSPDPHNHKHECTEECAQVCLTVWTTQGTFIETNVDYSKIPERARWSWPPRGV